MIDLIDRQDVLDAVNDCGICIQRILDIPSAEPERKKGEWIEDDYGFYRCSECGFEWDEPEMVSRFCPHCGAEMTRGGR